MFKLDSSCGRILCSFEEGIRLTIPCLCDDSTIYRDKAVLPPVAPYVGASNSGPPGEIDVLRMSRSPVSEVKGNVLNL